MALKKVYTVKETFDIALDETRGKLEIVIPNGEDAYGHRIDNKWTVEDLFHRNSFPLDKYHVVEYLMEEICDLHRYLTEALSDKAKLVETK